MGLPESPGPLLWCTTEVLFTCWLLLSVLRPTVLLRSVSEVLRPLHVLDSQILLMSAFGQRLPAGRATRHRPLLQTLYLLVLRLNDV